jgi:hypothetical protein
MKTFEIDGPSEIRTEHVQNASVKRFLGWGKTESTWYVDLLYQPRMKDDDDDCGAVGGMSGKGNRNTRRPSTPMPFCPPLKSNRRFGGICHFNHLGR